jgi:hypothetical protein
MLTKIAFAFAVFAFVIIIIWLTRPKRFKKGMEPNEPESEPATATSEQPEEDLSIEDSEGDGLMPFDDPMFPPDSDEEDS